MDPGEIQVRGACILLHALPDVSFFQAESVTFHLDAPVLRHKVFKPSYSCISSIRTYFLSLPAPVRDDELVVVGDRIFTDVVMANRMTRRRALPKPDSSVPESPEETSEKPQGSGTPKPTPADAAPIRSSRTGPLSIWTTGVWKREGTGMRFLEKSFMEGIRRYIVADNGVQVKGGDVSRFIRLNTEPGEPPKVEHVSFARRLWNRMRRG